MTFLSTTAATNWRWQSARAHTRARRAAPAGAYVFESAQKRNAISIDRNQQQFMEQFAIVCNCARHFIQYICDAAFFFATAIPAQLSSQR